MRIKNIKPKSLAKILGLTYAFLGLIGGTVFLIISLFAFTGSNSGILSLLFGLAAFVFAPILYGGMGYLIGQAISRIYNFIAKKIGGIEFEVE